MENHDFRLLLLFFLFLTPTFISHAAAQQASNSTGDNLNSNNVTPSMAVIVIVLVLAFFITGTVSIYIQQCTDSSTPSTFPFIVGGIAEGLSRRGQPRGLEKSVIDTFPTFMYSSVKELKIGKGSLECAVCLCEFEDDETLRLLPKCDHVFHSDCIDPWLAGHNTCPVCRANLVPEPANSAESNHQTNFDDMSEMETYSNSGDDQNQRREVRVTINDDETTALPRPKRNQNQKFPRSHSTGHSLSRPEEEWDRFTLRLPAEVRRQLVARARLKRATSMVALPPESISRRGYRRNGDGEGSGSSRYGRIFNFIFPPFISKEGSVRSTTKGGNDGDATAGSVSSKRSAANAVTSLESLPSLPV